MSTLAVVEDDAPSRPSRPSTPEPVVNPSVAAPARPNHAAALVLSLLSLLPIAATAQPGPAEVSPPERRLGADVAEKLAALPAAEAVGIGMRGTPTFLRGQLGQVRRATVSKQLDDGDLQSALGDIAPAFRLAPSDLIAERTRTDELGFTHVRYRQQKNGLPVVGTRLSLHVNDTGAIYAVSGNAYDGEILASNPGFPVVLAERAATTNLPGTREKQGSRLVYLFSNVDQRLHLAWEVEVRGTGEEGPIDESVFVDASSGIIIDRQSRVRYAINRQVYTANNTDALPGTPRRFEGEAVTGDAHVDGNYILLERSYRYYRDAHGRDSIDGSGGALISTVHFRTNYSNAGSYGGPMFFGDGDGVGWGFSGLDSDVVTHEFTHGVTANESGIRTGTLGSRVDESFALDEAMSDIFAAAESAFTNNRIDQDTWKMAEIAKTPNIPGDALRYLDNPRLDGISADWYPNIVAGGDGHFNCGIPNLAFKLMVTGGLHPRAGTGSGDSYVVPVNVPNLMMATTISSQSNAMVRARSIFYRANTVYLGPGSQFLDARIATVQAALDLKATDAFKDPQSQSPTDVSAAVHLAWDAVGVPGLAATNPHPINLSTRVAITNPSEPLIVGFTVSGTGSTAKPILLRAVGPTLAQFGVTDAMANPRLQQGTLVNDDWSNLPTSDAVAIVEQAAARVGAFPLPQGSLDSALYPALEPGGYTMIVSSASGGTGSVLAEVYDAYSPNPTHLTNLSCRFRVAPTVPLLGGMVINGSSPKWVLIRAVGPKLAAFGVSDFLTDPQLTVSLAGQSGALYANNDWCSGTYSPAAIELAMQQAGAFALDRNSKDAVLVVNLPPGGYNIQATSANGASGQCLLEVYEMANPPSEPPVVIGAASVPATPVWALGVAALGLGLAARRRFQWKRARTVREFSTKEFGP